MYLQKFLDPRFKPWAMKKNQQTLTCWNTNFLIII